MRAELSVATDAITEALDHRDHLAAPGVSDALAQVDAMVASLSRLLRWLANEAGRISTDSTLHVADASALTAPSRMADDASRALFHASYLLSEATSSIRPAHAVLARLGHDQPTEQSIDVHARRAA